MQWRNKKILHFTALFYFSLSVLGSPACLRLVVSARNVQWHVKTHVSRVEFSKERAHSRTRIFFSTGRGCNDLYMSNYYFACERRKTTRSVNAWADGLLSKLAAMDSISGNDDNDNRRRLLKHTSYAVRVFAQRQSTKSPPIIVVRVCIRMARVRTWIISGATVRVSAKIRTFFFGLFAFLVLVHHHKRRKR